MNRFDTYVPIKFDVPMFIPDFAALEALQTQKQKTLDDFRNQADLIASSIKDDPYDPTIKEKKIKDIMASKDAIVNEMLRNPSKGNSLLSQYQNTLKNDILFGDISKVNARALDYEQKIADLKTQPLWNDPVWRKGALEEIKNSYGDFQTEQGFGKTKGDDFAHTFYTVSERDAIINSYIDKVAHDKYDEEVRLRPELASEKTYDMWYSQTKHDKLSYDKLLKAALPQALADTRLQDFYETEGRLRGLGEGQGKIKLKTDERGNPIYENGHLVIDDNTLFGQALHGNINERVVDNSSTSYTPRTADKVRMKDEQAYHTAERLAAQAHQQRMENARIQAQKEKDIRDIQLQLIKLDQEKIKAGQSLTGIPRTTEVTKIDAGVLNQQIEATENKIREIESNPLHIEKGSLNAYKSLLANQKSQFDSYVKNSPSAKDLVQSSEVRNADWIGTSLTKDFSQIRNNRAEQVIKDINAGKYWSAGLNIIRTAGNMLGEAALLPVTLGLDAFTGLLNLNDYTPEGIEKGTGILISPIKGYEEQLTKSVLTNQSWEDFLRTPVGKELKSQGSSESFGVLNSAKKHYEAAQQYLNSGLWKLETAIAPKELLVPMNSQKEGDAAWILNRDMASGVDNGAFTYQGKPLKTAIVEQYKGEEGFENLKESDIVIDNSKMNNMLIAGQENKIGTVFEYTIKDNEGKVHKEEFTGTLDVSSPGAFTSIKQAHSSIYGSAVANNPDLLEGIAMSSATSNMQSDILILETLPQNTSFTPTNTTDPLFYQNRGITVQKTANNTYAIYENGNKIAQEAATSLDVLTMLEKERLKAMNPNKDVKTIQDMTPEERSAHYLKLAQEIYNTK